MLREAAALTQIEKQAILDRCVNIMEKKENEMSNRLSVGELAENKRLMELAIRKSILAFEEKHPQVLVENIILGRIRTIGPDELPLTNITAQVYLK